MNTEATPPIAVATIPNKAIVCIFIADDSSSRGRRRGALGGIEGGGETLFLAVVARTLPEFRPADAGRFVRADEIALSVLPGHLVDEQVLRDDDVSFEPDHLRDVSDLAGAVAQ